MKKSLFLILLISVFYSCKKEQITNSCGKSIIGKWKHTEIKYFGASNFSPSQDGHVLNISKDSVFEWNASYKLNANQFDFFFSEINYHETGFFSISNDTLSLSFSNGNISRYARF